MSVRELPTSARSSSRSHDNPVLAAIASSTASPPGPPPPPRPAASPLERRQRGAREVDLGEVVRYVRHMAHRVVPGLAEAELEQRLGAGRDRELAGPHVRAGAAPPAPTAPGPASPGRSSSSDGALAGTVSWPLHRLRRSRSSGRVEWEV